MNKIINEDKPHGNAPIVLTADEVIDYIKMELGYCVLKCDKSTALLIYDRSKGDIRLLYLKNPNSIRAGFYSEHTILLCEIQKYIDDGQLYMSSKINFD